MDALIWQQCYLYGWRATLSLELNLIEDPDDSHTTW
jgi:hypothetical protein